MVQRVSYFEDRREGPEAILESCVADKIAELFDDAGWPMWMGGSMPVGAGKPDLVSVWYQPEVVSLAEFSVKDGSILAYLRSVRQAKLETIASRIRTREKSLKSKLDKLQDLSAVERSSRNSFCLSPAWRKILPQIVTVEAKVSDWSRALQQAARNRIFADRSFVAMPHRVAARLCKEPGYIHHGVGVIGVHENGDVEICKSARRSETRVWEYYFHVAGLAAKEIRDGVYC